MESTVLYPANKSKTTISDCQLHPPLLQLPTLSSGLSQLKWDQDKLQLQDISPDTKTFLIFVEYHISNTGDIDTIAQYLDDMQGLGIAPTGKIFVDLFRGFYYHNRVGFTWWTAEKLEKVWQSFQQLAEQEQSRVYWGKWIVIWMLRAYTRCCGRSVALQKWAYAKPRWHQAEEHEQLMLSIIRRAADRSKYHVQR